MKRTILKTCCALLVASCAIAADSVRPQTDTEMKTDRDPKLPPPAVQRSVDLSAEKWSLWPDQKAEWKNDPLFLPSQVKLETMPVNPPTGGWAVLSPANGLKVQLPSTVEEHFWGAFGSRPYTDEISVAAFDPTIQNGNYLGVSWWWRHFKAPEIQAGQRLIIRFRAARLRAEVYCNGVLCGYSILPELPFEADVTGALQQGKENLLAVRITNPGGRLDWADYGFALPDKEWTFPWGQYRIPWSHGFGGLDAGIEMMVRDPVYVSDLAVLNLPEPGRIRILAEVQNQGASCKGPLNLRISGKEGTLWTGRAEIDSPASELTCISLDVDVPNAQPWTLEKPHLYQLEATPGSFVQGAEKVSFGFRWFNAEGIGSDAQLRLNGKRVVLKSACSWNYWPGNGIWPGREMAEKDIRAAKTIGLNALQRHRNLANPEVLDAHDRLGLLTYEEPGSSFAAFVHPPYQNPWACPSPTGVVDTSGAGGGTGSFEEQYAEAKIMAMVRRDRSHPSLIAYCIQNEMAPDLRNPRIHYLLRKIHALDPSRIVVLKSGVHYVNQAFMLPYEDKIHIDDGTGYSGWHDEHGGLMPLFTYDGFYRGPDDYALKSICSGTCLGKADGKGPSDPVLLARNRQEIVMWGEMQCYGAPDDQETILNEYRKAGRQKGYDIADRENMLGAYNIFLDQYGFRPSLGNASRLFQSVGDNQYLFWRLALENGRMTDSTDYLVIQGWEGGVIENHSGIVDLTRGFKGDPALLRRSLEPEVLVIRPRARVLEKNAKLAVDFFLINETGRSGPHRLDVSVVGESGAILRKATQEVQVTGGDVFGQPLGTGMEFPASEAGLIRIQATLAPAKGKALAGSDAVRALEIAPVLNGQEVVVLSDHPALSRTLQNRLGAKPVAWHPETTAKRAIVGGSAGAEWRAALPALLQKVEQDGMRLVFWPDTAADATAFAEALAQNGVVKFDGMVGADLPGGYMGGFYFNRPHWLFQGLPANGAMDWTYQIPPTNPDLNGMLLQSDQMEVVAGYGRDHHARVGIAACVIKRGKGEIVLLCFPGLLRAIDGGNAPFHPVTATCLLENTLR